MSMPIIFRTNKKQGFTIVELTVVIAILGIMATMSFVGYTNVQKQARDDQRMSSAVVVSESLEKYYSQHGEYPSVAKVTASNATTVKQLLGITNIDSLIALNAPIGSTTNTWKVGDASSINRLTYYGNTDTSSACRTGTGATDVCEDYRIQYYKEKTGTIETILSRNKSVAAPVIPPPAAPGATTVSVTLSGSDALATSTAATCTSPASPQYAYQSRTNDGAWSAYSTWGTATTASTPASQGVKYGFQFKARCIDGSLISAESAVSNEGTYTRPIATPAAPIVTESTSGATSTWTWNATTCPAGTTARYQYRLVADWGYTSVWYGPYTALYLRTWDTSSQGYEYIVQVQTHCYTAFFTSNWSGTGQDAYIRPVAAPTGITFGISRYAADVVHVSGGATCHSSVWLYSRADPHTWDYLWQDTQAYGWYATSHGGVWTVNTWSYNGNPVVTGATNAGYGPFASGSRWNIAVDLKCRNTTTGRESTSTGRVESPTMNLP